MNLDNHIKEYGNKRLILGLVVGLIVGLIAGFVIDFPNKFEIVFEVKNDTQDWYDNVWDDINSTRWENMCCFPEDCPQAVNNPEQCTCIYMVECFTTNETK